MLENKITRTNWPDLVFMAEGDGEWFEQVTVVTLKSHYVDKVYEAAWTIVRAEGVDVDRALDELAMRIMESRSIKVKQYVKTNEFCEVEVCLNYDEITDAVVEEALELLIDFGVTPSTRIELGESLTFLPEDVPKYKFEPMLVPTVDIPVNEMYSYQRYFYR